MTEWLTCEVTVMERRKVTVAVIENRRGYWSGFLGTGRAFRGTLIRRTLRRVIGVRRTSILLILVRSLSFPSPCLSDWCRLSVA